MNLAGDLKRLFHVKFEALITNVDMQNVNIFTRAEFYPQMFNLCQIPLIQPISQHAMHQ